MILINANTTQTPLASQGRTGPQSVKFIPAPRVYIASPDYSTPANVVLGRSNGNTPSGFIDLGIVDGSAKVGVTRTTNPVYVGVDNLLVGNYSESIKGAIDFSLSQFDDYALEAVSGIAVNSYTTNLYANFLMGGQDLKPVRLLLVMQNKLDGKEWQFYNPCALLSFTIDTSEDSMSMKVSGILPAYSGVTSAPNQLLSVTILSGDVPGYGLLGYGISYGG